MGASPHSSDTRTPVSSSSRRMTSSRRPTTTVRLNAPGPPRATAHLQQRGDVVIGQEGHRLVGWSGDLDAVGRSDLQFSFGDQPSAEPAHAPQPGGDRRGLGGLSELGQPCRDGVPDSSSSTAGRSLPASHWPEYRTLWLYSSMVRGAFAAARRCRRKDDSRSSRWVATSAGDRASERCSSFEGVRLSAVLAVQTPGAARLDPHRLARHLRGAKPGSAVQRGRSPGRP